MIKQINMKTSKKVITFILAFIMMFSNLTGLIEVEAAGIATPVKITSAEAGSKEVKGTGLLGTNRRKLQNITTTIYVTVKNGSDIVEEASVIIEPTDKPKEWVVTLNNALVDGYTVYAKQKCNNDMSDEVSVVAKEPLASKYKNDLKMPTGKFWLEQFSSNIISEDEKAEALQMLKDANPTFADKIASIELKIYGIEDSKVAAYVITYTDDSKTEEIKTTGLQIVPVTEHSRKYTLEPYNVVSTVIKGKLDGEGPFNDIKVQFTPKLGESSRNNFCEGGTCKIDKNSADFQTIDVNPKTGEFSIDVGENTLELDKVIGIVVKEPHKFATCNSSTPEIAIPKVDVKDPKKLKPEEKEKIADAIRKANTTPGGVSKLPDGTEYTGGIPAVIQIDDSGNVKIFSGSDVKGNWGDNYKFVPETNEDGSYKLKDGAESNVTFNKPEELLSNLAPDTPKMENKNGNVVVTPNIEVDTDAKKVVVEYEGADGSKKTITATKTDTGWTVDNDKAKVDENGVVSFPSKEVKSDTNVNAYVVDNGGLVPEEKALDSTKAELKIENKYKVTYDPNGGQGTMPEEEVNVGSKHRVKDNGFTAPKGKEFDHWMIGFEPKNPGEDTEVNNDIVIKAIWKYIINPTASEVETIVKHPVNYQMYKNAIKDFPEELTVEHIKVVTPPDISKVGGTQAKIEIRFSDGQFRTVPVTVNVKPDPKDKEIEKLNKDIEGLNKQITDLNNKISEKDSKITELNGKITELEGKLQECKNQCAIDKAECEKAKEALNKQIQDLTVEKTRLETVVKENRELIEQLRKEIAGLEKQVEDWKKVAGDKDTKIKELEGSINELNAKLETTNKANTELKEKLATANQEILNLKSKVVDLEDQVKDLTKKLNTKETEIKTLNETITSLKEKIAKLEAEKAKNKEAYDKEKANLEKQIQGAKDALTAKETELKEIKEELKTTKDDLATEKAKTSGLTEQVNAKDERIVDLEKQIADLKEQLKTADEGNTKIIKEKETIIKEKETLIEKLTSEKAELEKQLVAEKAKNENLEKQITDLNAKVDKANEDLNKTNENISNLEKELAVEKEKNKTLTEQLNKITTDLENKTKEVETLNGTVTELKEKIAKITAEQAKDKEACEKAKAELQEKLDKANQDLTDKNTELDNIKKEFEQAKKDLADEKAKNAGLTEKQKAQEEKIADLEAQLKTLQEKLNKADTDLKTANDRIAELEKELAEKDADNKNLTAQVEKLGKDLEAKTNEVNNLNTRIVELEKQVSEKIAKGEADAKEIKRLKAELEDLKNKLQTKSGEVDKLSKEIFTLKETVKTLEGEKTELTNNVTRLEKDVKELKEKLETANNKILELEKENAGLKADNKNLTDKVTELTGKIKNAEDENAALKSKIDDLNKQLAEAKNSQCDAEELNRLKQEKAALEAKLEGKDELIQELRNQIKDLKKAITDKDAENKEKITELENKINNLTSENTRLKEQLAEANTNLENLKKELQAEKDKNKELEEEKAGLEKDKSDLQNTLNKSEEEKAKLQDEKDALEGELNKLKEDLDKCPPDSTDKIKELEDKIAEQEKLIAKKDKDIAEKTDTIESLRKQLEESDKKVKELESRPNSREKEYIYVGGPSRGNYQLEVDNSNLSRENRELKQEVSNLKDNLGKYDKEKYVTIFDLNSILYKTYLGDELLTQAEMTDFNGFIKPFVENNRTMLPIRYAARSLGIDVNWDNKTRTATFTNSGKNNVLKPGKVTINADTLEMKDQNGKVITVDSKPMVKAGRFYVSLTNLTKAFGGTNGNVNDGISNTIEWNGNTKQVLVYKYVK